MDQNTQFRTLFSKDVNLLWKSTNLWGHSHKKKPICARAHIFIQEKKVEMVICSTGSKLYETLICGSNSDWIQNDIVKKGLNPDVLRILDVCWSRYPILEPIHLIQRSEWIRYRYDPLPSLDESMHLAIIYQNLICIYTQHE